MLAELLARHPKILAIDRRIRGHWLTEWIEEFGELTVAYAWIAAILITTHLPYYALTGLARLFVWSEPNGNVSFPGAVLDILLAIGYDDLRLVGSILFLFHALSLFVLPGIALYAIVQSLRHSSDHRGWWIGLTGLCCFVAATIHVISDMSNFIDIGFMTWMKVTIQ